jgi:large repetitive protein
MSDIILSYLSFSLAIIIPTIFFGYKYKNLLPKINLFKTSFVFIQAVAIIAMSFATIGTSTKVFAAGNPPVIADAAYTAQGGQTIPLPLLSNASDPDGDSIRVSMIFQTPITAGVPATIVLPSCGTINVTATGVVSFTATNGYNGICGSNSYFVTDSSGETTSQTLNITVSSPANRPPLVPDVPYTVQGGQTITLPLFANASDPDGDSMRVSWVINKTITAGTPETFEPPCGIFNVSATGVVTFTGATGYNGNCGSSAYAITDSNGATTYQTFNITVSSPVNNPPTLINPYLFYNFQEGQVITLPLISNFIDLDNDTLTLTSIEGQTIIPGEAKNITILGCLITVSATGIVTLTSITPNYGGFCDNGINYTVSDGKGGIVEDVFGARYTLNNPPISNQYNSQLDNPSYTVTAGIPKIIPTFWLNDSDPDGDSFVLSELGFLTSNGFMFNPVIQNQTNTFVNPDNPNQIVTIDPNGIISYKGTYDPGRPINQFLYKIKDSKGKSSNEMSGSVNLFILEPDTTPPLAPIVTSPLTGTVTTDPLPIFAGTGEPGSTIVVKDENGNLICTTTVNTQSNWSCQAIFGQSEGGHTYKVTQGDAAGNVSPDSLPVFLTFDIDTDTALLPIENAAPNNGDGNGDGVLDSSQGNVASKLDTANNNLYATLDAGNEGCTSISDYDFTPEAPLPTQDVNYDYPIGLFKFTIKCATPGQSVNVTFILDKLYNTTNWTYRKYNQNTQQYNNLPGVTYGTRVIAGNTVTTISFSAQDGGPLDEDGLANGEYTDPSGPSITTIPTNPTNGGSTITITNSPSTSSQSSTSSVSSQSSISSSSSQSSTTSSASSVVSSVNATTPKETPSNQIVNSNQSLDAVQSESDMKLPRTGGNGSVDKSIAFIMIILGLIGLAFASSLKKEIE